MKAIQHLADALQTLAEFENPDSIDAPNRARQYMEACRYAEDALREAIEDVQRDA